MQQHLNLAWVVPISFDKSVGELIKSANVVVVFVSVVLFVADCRCVFTQAELSMSRHECSCCCCCCSHSWARLSFPFVFSSLFLAIVATVVLFYRHFVYRFDWFTFTLTLPLFRPFSSVALPLLLSFLVTKTCLNFFCHFQQRSSL